MGAAAPPQKEGKLYYYLELLKLNVVLLNRKTSLDKTNLIENPQMAEEQVEIAEGTKVRILRTMVQEVRSKGEPAA